VHTLNISQEVVGTWHPRFGFRTLVSYTGMAVADLQDNTRYPVCRGQVLDDDGRGLSLADLPRATTPVKSPFLRLRSGYVDLEKIEPPKSRNTILVGNITSSPIE
jgi:hypothetical protein